MKPATSQTLPPGLYIVPTPIGNLGDMTLRAIDVLNAADLIACEDTRVSAKLLQHFSIKKPTVSYNDHNGEERRPAIFAALAQGHLVALISDAGTPLISDPGYKLVREALEKNIYVTALPGPSSVMTALCLSGLPTDRFFFAGFLSAKTQARKDDIANLTKIPATLVCFESANRLQETLELFFDICGNRQAAVVREISKLFEESRRGNLEELISYYAEKGAPRGEVVLVIAPPGEKETGDDELEANLQLLLKSHSIKEAASILAEEFGRPRRQIYSLALRLQEKKP